MVRHPSRSPLPQLPGCSTYKTILHCQAGQASYRTLLPGVPDAVSAVLSIHSQAGAAPDVPCWAQAATQRSPALQGCKLLTEHTALLRLLCCLNERGTDAVLGSIAFCRTWTVGQPEDIRRWDSPRAARAVLYYSSTASSQGLFICCTQCRASLGQCALCGVGLNLPSRH